MPTCYFDCGRQLQGDRDSGGSSSSVAGRRLSVHCDASGQEQQSGRRAHRRCSLVHSFATAAVGISEVTLIIPLIIIIIINMAEKILLLVSLHNDLIRHRHWS
jgi:hypothetical protein